MPFVKGQSGNPSGRPKKQRALTQALEDSLSKTVVLQDGTRLNGKRYLANIARDAITQGKITLASGDVITLSPDDMLMFWKFYFSQIDGPPVERKEVTGAEGGPIFVNIGENLDSL